MLFTHITRSQSACATPFGNSRKGFHNVKIDVAGRVKNTSLAASRPLLPLYEAVVNSIQAIEEAKIDNGRVRIVILRDPNLLAETATEAGDISGFEITDNGVGFNKQNLSAFQTADTTYKASRGGKGNGRFMWLVAFEYVEIESHFAEDNSMHTRTFTFAPYGEGVHAHTSATSSEQTSYTKISLKGFKPRYQKQCPKRLETIATHLIEHCLEFFIRPDCPDIIIEDSETGDIANLNSRFETAMAEKSDHEVINIEGQDFYLLHLRLYSSHLSDHLLHFCANNRAVKSEKLMGRLPNVARRLQDQNGREFVYAVYVDSKFLDERVNVERTDFSIEEDEANLLEKEITWQVIRVAILERCSHFLLPFTEPIKEKKSKRIEDFLAEEGPMYRSIVKYAGDTIDLIDPEINDDELDLQLYQAYHTLQLSVREEGQRLMRQDQAGEKFEDFYCKKQAYFEKLTDINSSDLARYVCHRRAILDFLDQQLGRANDGKYHLEENVHQVICPLRITTDDIPFEKHNLWVLDERLAFHAFLASDKPLNTNPHLVIDSRKEPDLLVFDKAIAFADGEPPYSAITIIEFKRPMRGAYDEKENPFVQVREYLTSIRDGKARTENGRDIQIAKDIPFTCYIVCDITTKLKMYAHDFELQETPDGQGFFGYKRQYNAFVEVISYTKMVRDAKKRNSAFFHKLGLPTSVSR